MQVGLCKNCQYVKKITNNRGSTFYLCQMSQQDPRFRKYPQLPVIKCPGYQPKPNNK